MASMQPRQQAPGERRGRLRLLTMTVLCWTRDGLIQWGWYTAGVTPDLLAALDQAWLSQGPPDPPIDGGRAAVELTSRTGGSIVSENAIRKVAAAAVEPNRRRGGELRVVLGPKTAGATTGFLGVLTLQPGEFVAEHYHPYSEEFLYVTRGLLTLRVDGTDLQLAAGEGVVVPIGARHRSVNGTGEPVEAVFHLCPLAPRPELGHVDTEALPQPAAPQLTIGG